MHVLCVYVLNLLSVFSGFFGEERLATLTSCYGRRRFDARDY